MRGLVLVALVLIAGCVDSRAGVAPVCDVGDDGDVFGQHRCDGELAVGGAVDWRVICASGAVSTRIDPETFDLIVDCDGECESLSLTACRTDQPTCQAGLEPVCVLADNVCEVAPDAYVCGS